LIISLSLTSCKKSSTGGDALILGSWRGDDAAQVKQLIAAFNQKHPDIKIEFQPTNPPDYNAVLRTQFEGDTAPDLFYARSFSTTRELYKKGYVESLAGLKGLNANFTSGARSPWSTEDGTPYAVPFMAVSHGIYYNKTMFKKMGIAIPKNWSDLIKVAKKIKKADITPFANGSKDEWDMNEIVFMNLLPNFIGGRKGRLEYENGKRKFNDRNMVAAFQAIKDIAPYLPKGQEGVDYYASQQLFLQGKAAMFFGGSWDITMFEKENPKFDWGVFATPAPKGKKAYVCFHADAGVGLNKNSKNKEKAKIFLQWLTTPESGKMLGNGIPGFFPLHKTTVKLSNKHANEFLALNKGRGKDVRFVWPELLAGSPSGYDLTQEGALAVAKGTMTPKQAADHLQNGLAKWYEKIKK
jgi:raffinose/stachyose/melibiose transport system substrate-binding protein